MDYGERLVHRVDAVYAHQHEEDGKRRHLGASVIGKKCLREIWFIWRWADYGRFEGRMLRLFGHGHREEEQFAGLLRSMGAEVWTADAQGKQFTVAALGGHFGGSLDGVVRGLPELPPEIPPGTPMLCEFKTHNDKWFKKLKKKRVKEGHPKHYKQAQIYMHLAELEWCLYCAVNKNDEELYFEVFPVDHSVGTHLLNRAETVIYGEGMPPRISETPTWYECRFCDMSGVCFKSKLPQVNCRTCKWSVANRDGTWSCQGNQPEIQTSPKTGCQHHQFLDGLC